MDYPALTAYFAALVALTAAPGPVVAVLVARSLGSDARGAAAFAAGLCLGDLLAVLAVALGLGGFAQTSPEWFGLLKYAGVAYLFWLAARIWRDSTIVRLDDPARQGFLSSAAAGLALCLGNPSTVLIYMLLLPSVAPGGIGTGQDLLAVLLITFAAVGVVFFGAILLARQFSRLIASPRSAIWMSRGTAGVIGATSVWMLAV